MVQRWLVDVGLYLLDEVTIVADDHVSEAVFGEVLGAFPPSADFQFSVAAVRVTV